MTIGTRKFLAYFLAFGVLCVGGHSAPAAAGMIGTGEAVQRQSERERVKALVARPEVARKLETLGVLPKDAAARVDALTDAEVASLAGRIDALPAGGFETQEWLLIIIAILLLILVL